MKLEYLGEQIFLREVEAVGEVWVVKGESDNIFALQLDASGFSLPVWSHRDRVLGFLSNARLMGADYEPHPIPLDIFTQIWLSDKMTVISELLLNMDGQATNALALTVEQFRFTQEMKKAS